MLICEKKKFLSWKHTGFDDLLMNDMQVSIDWLLAKSKLVPFSLFLSFFFVGWGGLMGMI